MLGPAPVVDFDGTVAHLKVDWITLRAELEVATIDDLWKQQRAEGWDIVARAEAEAAGRAQIVPVVEEGLIAARAVAILTSNAEQAVGQFLARYPDLERRVAIVVGRETLRGPKTDFAVFERGFNRCVDRTRAARGDAPVVYLGDRAYELGFARRLGAAALKPQDLLADPR